MYQTSHANPQLLRATRFWKDNYFVQSSNTFVGLRSLVFTLLAAVLRDLESVYPVFLTKFDSMQRQFKQGLAGLMSGFLNASVAERVYRI